MNVPGFFSWALRPGIAINRQVSMSAKLILLAVAICLVVVGLLTQTLMSTRDDVELARREVAGTDVMRSIAGLISATERLRGLSAMRQAGGGGQEQKIDQARAEIRSIVAQLDQTVQAHAGLELQASWDKVKQGQLELIGAGSVSGVEADFSRHTAQIYALRALLFENGDRSQLLLDPEASTYYLVDLSINRLIALRERVAQARGLGAAALARHATAQEMRGQLLDHADEIDDTLSEARWGMESLARAGAVAPPLWEQTVQATTAFSALLKGLAAGEGSRPEPEAFFARGTEALEAHAALYGQCLDRLSQLLTERAAAAERKEALTAAGSFLALMGTLYFMISFFVSTMQALKTLKLAMHEAEQGNLAQRLDIRGRDEITAIGQDLDKMMHHISEMVAAVRSNSTLVSMTGEKLADDSQALSGRTEEQAASLEQTCTGIRAVSETVALHARDAQEVSQSMAQLTQAAKTGETRMIAATSQFQSLQRNSDRMGEIISTIDSIAFQTNILALNAAIEAARAGEAGRGFAVVASEVRMLAQRSQTAAHEIRGLIAASTREVADCVASMKEVEAVLTGLQSEVDHAAGSVAQIANASDEQSSALVRVVQDIGSLDELTQKNAELVGVSRQRSQRLLERASDLQTAVMALRLQQGSADEAVRMVNSARELILAKGWDNAFREIHAPQSEYIDRDLYIFVFDRQGYYRMCAASPERVDRPLSAVPGLDAARLVQEAWEAVDSGGGWVDYDIVNPKTGAVQGKSSYVVHLRDNQLIGCGIYRKVAMAV